MNIKRFYNFIAEIHKLSNKELYFYVRHFIKVKVRDNLIKLLNVSFSSYTNKINLTYINILNNKLEWECSSKQNLEDLVCLSDKYYLKHKFNILGSGWVEWSPNNKANGIEGYLYNSKPNKDHNEQINFSNRKKSNYIRKLIDKNYNCIDWHRDMKSGYRFSSNHYFNKQSVSHFGVDIKVPWELARLHHLVQLGIVFSYTKKNEYIKEFRNQVLDFISMNPRNWGVNWACTMDVSIRAANLILAFSLFEQNDTNKVIDSKFKRIFLNYLYDHGKFITRNLEYREKLTSNHYLSNVVGLIYISVFLKYEPKTDLWLAFSTQELFSEVNKQFYDDGGNFESSTFYHRLSSEMVIFGVFALLGLSKCKRENLRNYNHRNMKIQPKLNSLDSQVFEIKNDIVFPKWFIEKLSRIKDFSEALIMPNGEAVQFGDNDSGRFFNLFPLGNWIKTEQAIKTYVNLENYTDSSDYYFDENHLRIDNLMDSLNALFNEKSSNLIDIIVKSISNNNTMSYLNSKKKSITLDEKTPQIKYLYSNLKIFEYNSVNNHTLDLLAFQDFGLYIIKNESIFIAISASSNGQNGYGGHSHNDKLSFELMIDKKRIVSDPGTYIYTPFPEIRNKFRSIKIHSGINVRDIEQNFFYYHRNYLFKSLPDSKCKLISHNYNSLVFELNYGDVFVIREFSVESKKIIIKNLSNYKFKDNYNFRIFSNGYGKLRFL